MKNPKKLLAIILTSYALVLAVNITGNYQYYAAGNDWHYSVYFSLGLTTFCWAGFMLLHHLVFKRFTWSDRPTLKIILGASIFAIGGAAMTFIAIKMMVLFNHHTEQPVQEYIYVCTYAAMFSMIIGLMITGQQSLLHLKKSIEENEQMKQEMIQSQYETLKSQVNPHFLFNSLNTLTVMIPGKPDVAVNFVEQMSKVFRYSLQHSGENTIDVGTELKVVRSYLFLNEQRFDGKLLTDLKIDDAVLQKRIITQSLLMLVENAIKHNELSHENPLAVSIYSEGKYLVVKNTLQRKTQVERSTHVGLENIKKRYALAVDVPVIIEDGNNFFIVKIPLL